MTTERDELSALIWATETEKLGTFTVGPTSEAADKIADAIIAAGWRPPPPPAHAIEPERPTTMPERDELAKYKRGAKTLGEIIEKQCRDVLEVTGLHHLINEDGDGHWDVVWMRLFEMRDELASLKESTIARERARGDSWRDRAQEMTARAEAAEAAIQRVRYLLDATEPERYAILSMEGLRVGLRSALEEGEPA